MGWTRCWRQWTVGTWMAAGGKRADREGNTATLAWTKGTSGGTLASHLHASCRHSRAIPRMAAEGLAAGRVPLLTVPQALAAAHCCLCPCRLCCCCCCCCSCRCKLFACACLVQTQTKNHWYRSMDSIFHLTLQSNSFLLRVHVTGYSARGWILCTDFDQN